MTTEAEALPPAQTTRTVTRLCPLCGRDNTAEQPLRYGTDPWPLKQCAGCGMVYLERAPDLSELYENLAWEKQFSAGNTRRHEGLAGGEEAIRKALRRFRPLPRKTPAALVSAFAPSGPVVDLGCGSGDHLSRLESRFTPIGVEISKALAEEARARLEPRGGAVINADALAGLKSLPDGHCAAVTMRSFLEHDINPGPILHEARRVLAPGGVVVIKVPNYGSWNRRVRGAAWCGFRFPDHVNYFTPATLRGFLDDAGLKVLRFGLLERPPTSDNMWLVARRPRG